MTGFAKSQVAAGGKTYTIEIKSLNSKQVDASLKLPASFRQYELPLRTAINRLERGKIDFYITEEASSDAAPAVDSVLVASRFRQLVDLCVSMGITADSASLLAMVMQQPDVWASSAQGELTEEQWNTILDAVEHTIDELDATRLHEGEILRLDFIKHLDLIERYLGEIPQYEAERIATAKERMRSYLADASVKEVDENRFEQELIYYLEKLDITEEKVRLAKHIQYFRDVMDNEPSSGKKLAFIAQEMGREINTTGSKANHVEIQRLVVAMKDELEKIKEQLGNIL